MTSPRFHSRPDCPACGTPGLPVFSRAYDEPRLRAALTAFYAEVGGLDYPWLEGQSYAVATCPRCGTCFQTAVPADDLLAKLYEEWIDPTKARLRFHSGQPSHHFLALAREVHLALALTAAGAPRTTLDYGCGWGEWSRMTQAFGCEAWGTELSPTRREHAVRHGIRVVAEGDLPDAFFGQINLDQVLEHVPAPRACLQLLAAKLHPSGSLRLAVPRAGRVPAALGNFDRELLRPRLGGLNAIAPLEHLNAFTTTGLLTLAAECGLVRIVPPWSVLLRGLVFPPGITAKLKTLLRPFYLRSAHTTQLYFRRIG
jgi:SAM-dependent methyltransferase